MKKPLNKFALLLWAVAIVVAVDDIWSFYGLFQTAGELGPTERFYVVSGTVLKIASSVLVQTGILLSLGILIEMVDQIRWHIVRAP